MLQTIQTKYLGPTNSRGSRVKAYCQAGSITVGWLYDLESKENHKRAVLELIKKLDWADWVYSCGWSADDRGITAVVIGRRGKVVINDAFNDTIINY